MGTKDTAIEEPTRIERGTGFVRNALAGHPQGAIRRITLYGLAILCIATGLWPLAILFVFLLAVTDQLA